MPVRFFEFINVISASTVNVYCFPDLYTETAAWKKVMTDMSKTVLTKLRLMKTILFLSCCFQLCKGCLLPTYHQLPTKVQDRKAFKELFSVLHVNWQQNLKCSFSCTNPILSPVNTMIVIISPTRTYHHLRKTELHVMMKLQRKKNGSRWL
jgi:hypothetical protein